ncbi:MAG TPA: 50S ribosomal protein P1 [Candidatus Bathyarchaeota archaeon]|nr:50S ribosomal protein P1 [Candidatus Bathyarchaeota archaeon]HEW89752.1 50S ribosomal protein P1 [Candidatus Bathyarchaeota archaeon]
MEYIYAAMLLHRAGKESNEENLTRVLEAAGVEVDPIRVKSLVAALKEIDIDEAIKATPIGFPTVATVSPAAAGPAEEAKAPEEEESKEEEEEEEEEEALAGLASLFG